jgi:hypothetical protein
MPAGSVWPATARPQETIDRLLPTIRYDVRFESDRIREFGFPGFHRIRQGGQRRRKHRAAGRVP